MTQQLNQMEMTVTAPPEQLAAFAQMCKTIERLCLIGGSRTVQVHVDGDGSANMRFDFGGVDVEEIEFPSQPASEDIIRVPSIGD